MDMSKCRKEAPMAVSHPHFLFAGPEYLNRIDGMNPDETKHQHYEQLEPVCDFLGALPVSSSNSLLYEFNFRQQAFSLIRL